MNTLIPIAHELPATPGQAFRPIEPEKMHLRQLFGILLQRARLGLAVAGVVFVLELARGAEGLRVSVLDGAQDKGTVKSFQCSRSSINTLGCSTPTRFPMSSKRVNALQRNRCPI